MRSLLILAGLLVAGIVAFAVAWPRLVDAELLRAELGRLLRTASGSELELQGAVRLELLPLPRISIERVALGDRSAATAGSRFEADRIDVEIAPLALLAGRVEPRRLQLVRPRLSLAERSGEIVAKIVRALDSGDLADIRRVDIIDGAAALPPADGTAWPRAIEAMDLSATREGANGFRVEGTAAVAGESLRVELRGEPLQLGAPIALAVSIASGPRETPATMELQGTMRPDADGLQLAGRLRVSALQAPLPVWLTRAMGVEQALPRFDLRAGLSLLPGGALRLDDLDLTIAGGQLRGSFALALGAAPNVDLMLEGTQLTATPELLQDLRRLGPLLTSTHGATGRLGLNLATIDWQGGQIRRLRAELTIVPDGRLDLRQLEATLPGDTAVTWASSGRADGDALLTGALTVHAGELRALLGWLGVAAADLPTGGLTSLDLTAATMLHADRLNLRELSARVDATQLRGMAAFAVGARPRLDLAMTLDRVNLALYLPEPPGLLAGGLWRHRLANIDGTLDLAVERPSYDALRGRDLRLRLAADGGKVALDELRFGDLGDASLRLRGSVDLADASYDLAGEIEVAQPKPILRLLQIEAPPELQRLAPLRLAGKAKGGPAAAGLQLRLDANGASATLAGTLDGPAGTALAGTLAAVDTAELLVALGWPAPADLPAFGPLDLGVEVRRGGGPYGLSLRGAVGASDLSGEATIDGSGPRARLAGKLHAKLLDTGLLAALYETAALPLAFAPGRPWLWPGVWPSQPLAWRWLDALDLALAVDVERLRHGGRDLPGLAGRALLQHGRLALSGLTLPLADGSLSGTVTLERADGYVVVGTDLKLTGARAEKLVAALAPGSELTGEVDLAAGLLAQGRSVADLVGTLRGAGELMLRAGRLPEQPPLDVSGPFEVSDGVLTGRTAAATAAAASLWLRLDLLAWMLDATITTGEADQRFLGAPGRMQPVGP